LVDDITISKKFYRCEKMQDSNRRCRRKGLLHERIYIYLISLLINAQFTLCGSGDIWPLDRPDGMPSIQSLEVMCGKDHMDVHLTFSQPFEGIVSSKGQHGDPRCVYVPPSTGQTFFSFRIAYSRCGTKPDLHGQFYENTVVVQYDKDLLEVWDEAKRLRCEWFNDYEKTASKPPMVIADLDVIQLDFRGDNVDCWMEIQHGKGPWAPPVSGIVPLGSTLTLVVAINDYRGEFDMRVKSCVASDGGSHVIQLSDEFGCVLRPKMISRFLKAKGADERASVITYAFFHAFKFPDSLSVHIKCKVEICRHGCLDHCQQQQVQHSEELDLGLGLGLGLGSNSKEQQYQEVNLAHYGSALERKDEHVDKDVDDDEEVKNDDLYDDIIHQPSDEKVRISNKKVGIESQEVKDSDDKGNTPQKDAYTMEEKFPHGPRTFSLPGSPRSMEASPRSIDDDVIIATVREDSSTLSNSSIKHRRKRSMTVSNRNARSADVGVSGLYEVISEADLAFSPDNKAEAVTVFQGKIREEVVYGICMPVNGFSLLFVMVAVSAVISALVAGSLLYRYQLQREHIVEQARSGALAMSAFANWVRGAGLWRQRVGGAEGKRTRE